MSIANILAANRRSDVNVCANSMKLAPLTSAQRNSFPPSMGQTVYDSDYKQLVVYNGTAWQYVPNNPSNEPLLTCWSTVNDVGIAVGGVGNPCVGNNCQADIISGGLQPNSEGVLTITKPGVYQFLVSVQFATGVPMAAGVIYLTISDATNTPAGRKFRYWENTQRTTTQFTTNFSGVATLAAGDTIALWIENATTQAITVDQVPGSPRLTQICVEYLGPYP